MIGSSSFAILKAPLFAAFFQIAVFTRSPCSFRRARLARSSNLIFYILLGAINARDQQPHFFMYSGLELDGYKYAKQLQLSNEEATVCMIWCPVVQRCVRASAAAFCTPIGHCALGIEPKQAA